MNASPTRGARILARTLTALAVLTTAGTFVAAQIDLARRHIPGIPPARYLWPQARAIWIPGLVLALAFALIAAFVNKRRRGRR